MSSTEKNNDALKLAALLQCGADDPMWDQHCEMRKDTVANAAIELRRLHAENDELRADADRYRWLKTPRLHVGHGSIFLKIDDRSRGEWPPARDLLGEEMDCAIDAARETQKGGAA